MYKNLILATVVMFFHIFAIADVGIMPAHIRAQGTKTVTQVSTTTTTTTVATKYTLNIHNVAVVEGADGFLVNVNFGDGSSSEKKFEFDLMNAYSFIQIFPSVKFTLNPSHSGMVLSGDFKPATKYKLIIKKGFHLLNGGLLEEDFNNEFRTLDFKPKIKFLSKARYVPGSLAGQISFEAVNVNNIEVTIRQVLASNLHQWLTSYERADQYVSDELSRKVIEVKEKKNKKHSGVINLEDLKPVGQGIYVITAKSVVGKSNKTNRKKHHYSIEPVSDADSESGESSEGDGEEYYDRYSSTKDNTTVVVTNITSVVKLGNKNTVKVWALKTNDLSHMSGVTVILYSQSNRELDRCITDTAHGECSLKWKNNKDTLPYAVVLKSQSDSTYIRFGDLNIRNDRFHVGTRDYISDEQGYDAFVYSGRDLYRPGESVDLAVQVRNKKFDVAAKLPVVWKIINPKGKIIREMSNPTDEFGMATLQFQTQIHFETGKYNASLWVGKNEIHSFPFLVEEFVPERIGLRINAKKDEFISKNIAEFSLDAFYLFGPPVANTDFKVNCSMYPAFKKIPKNPDYSTGPYLEDNSKVINLDEVTGVTDANGKAQFNCDYAQTANGKLQQVYELKAKTEIAEAGGGRVTVKTGSALVASTDVIIGLKLKEKKNQEISITGGLFSLKGLPIKKTTNLVATLYRIQEDWNYSYDYESTNNWRVHELVIPAGLTQKVSVNGSQFEFLLKVPSDHWGRWLVRVEDPVSGYVADLDAGYLDWYFGDSSSGPKIREPEDLKLELSKKEVSPNESFKVLVQAPFAGRLLLTAETDGVVESKWVQVAKRGPVEIEMKAPAALPNFYITGLLLKNPTEGKRFMPARAWGAGSIRVIPSEHKLKVKVAVPSLMESRKELVVNISNEQNEKAEYSVAVVDEGILQMTGYKSPDPLSRFFDPRKLGVITSETLGWTMSGQAKGKVTAGGDKAQDGQNKNMPVRLVAYFSGQILSDATGKAQVKFSIPEFQGKVRVMVVASAKSKMGSAESQVTVRDPIVIQATLPRFLTQGDSFQFPVSLTNSTGKDQSISLKIETTDGVTISNSEQVVQLSNNQMKTVKFSSVVKATMGVVEFRIAAKSADGKLMSSDSFSIKVKPQGVERTLHLSFQAAETVNIEKQISADWRKDFIAVDATISNSPFLRELSTFKYLLHYPYGCIEQTSSGTLPLLVMEDLLKFIDRNHNKPIKEMVQSGIARILSMQTPSGGFSYWQGGTEPVLWGTGYATFVLIQAKKLGYEVSKESIDAALDYMQASMHSHNYLLSQKKIDESMADPFALFVLALGGRQVTSELRSIISKGTPENLSGTFAENKFLLTVTAKILGDQDSLKKLLKNEAELVQPIIGEKEYYYSYWSSMRSDSMRLAILQLVWPELPGLNALTQRVVTNLKQTYYWSTQEIGWSAFALGYKVSKLNKIDRSKLKSMILNVNKMPAKGMYEVQQMPTWHLEGGNALVKSSLAVSPQMKPEDGMWLYLNITGTMQSVPAGNGIFSISRSFYKRNGDKVNISDVKQGDVIVVGLSINSQKTFQNVAIVDRLASGFEIENSRLGREEEMSWIDKESLLETTYQDIRDDRMQYFGNVTGGKYTKKIYYTIRAVTVGHFVIPPPMIEEMYDPGTFAYGIIENVQIKDKK